MSKAVLIIDMPESCEECPLQLEVESGKKIVLGVNICRGSGMYNQDSSKKPEWCYLRPMPEKMECPGMNGVNYEAGWNSCIDAIEGGEDEAVN